MNFEKAYKIKLENEIKKVKEYHENQSKQHLVQSSMNMQNLKKEKEFLILNINNNNIEKNLVENKFKVL